MYSLSRMLIAFFSVSSQQEIGVEIARFVFVFFELQGHKGGKNKRLVSNPSLIFGDVRARRA